MAERAKKATDETEKDQPAGSAAPSAGKQEADKRTFEEFQEASFALFGVQNYVVVGAVLDAGLDTDKPLERSQVQTAINDFLKREVK